MKSEEIGGKTVAVAQLLKKFIAEYAKANNVSERLAVPKYDHYVRGADDFAECIERNLARLAPQPATGPKFIMDVEELAKRQAEQIAIMFNGDLSGGTSIRSVLANVLRAALPAPGASGVDVESAAKEIAEFYDKNATMIPQPHHIAELIRKHVSQANAAIDVEGLAREIDSYYMGLPEDYEVLGDLRADAVIQHVANICRKHIAQPAAPQGDK